MSGRVVYEYDPATGQTVATPLPDDLFTSAPGSAADKQLGVPSAPPATGPSLGFADAGGATRRLSDSGKEKVKRFVTQAKTLEELADIDAALDAGRLSDSLAARLHLSGDDFLPLSVPAVRTPSGQVVPTPVQSPAQPTVQQVANAAQAITLPAAAAPGATTAAPPPGALGLTPSGLLKVRHAIQAATNMDLLAILDKALTQGDIAKLQELLILAPEDLQGEEEEAVDVAGEDDALTEPSDEDEDYDPFATEPSVVAVESQKPQSSKTAAKSKPRPSGGVIGGLQSEYDNSDSDHEKAKVKTAAAPSRAAATTKTPHTGRPSKRRRRGSKQEMGEPLEEKPKTLAWPVEWAWLVSRTQRHKDFRQPTMAADSCWAKEPPEGQDVKIPQPRIVAVSTSMIYVGDSNYGYDPRHLARVTAVDERGSVLVDAIVKPRAPILDYRTHLTGLTKESFDEGALDLETVISQLLDNLHPRTLLVGHRLNSDLEALHLWHGPLVDVSLLFGVEGRKQHQYHSLRYLAEVILGEEVEEDAPYDPLEAARQALKLAQHEAKRSEQTAPFPPKAGNACELSVRHVPIEWRSEAETRVAALCPGALRSSPVNWLLSENDPTDWRGDTVLTFASASVRDTAFEALQGLTDVHIQWQDLPGAPPLGAFLTEQSLIKAFSQFGVVVSARIPRKPTTREPQSFAFVSYQVRQDAERVARQQVIEVQLTPTWTLPLRPRLAKFGQSSDKRVAVCTSTEADQDDGFAPLDWVHVFRR